MRLALKILIVLVVVVLVSILAAMAFLNQYWKEQIISTLESYEEFSRTRSFGTFDRQAMLSVCDIDLSNKNLACINASTGELVNCAGESAGSDGVIIRNVELGDCDKGKVDSAIADLSAYDSAQQTVYVQLSASYALSDFNRYELEALNRVYSEENPVFPTRGGDTVIVMLPIISMGSLWGQTMAVLSACRLYDEEEKRSECIASAAEGFGGLADEIETDIVFDSSWKRTCSINMRRMIQDERGSSGSQLADLLMSAEATCERMALVYGDVMDGLDSEPQNDAERLFTVGTLYMAERFAATGELPTVIEYELAQRMGPEFSEARASVMEDIASGVA